EVVEEEAEATIEVVEEEVKVTIEVVEEEAEVTIEVVEEEAEATIEVVEEEVEATVEAVEEEKVEATIEEEDDDQVVIRTPAMILDEADKLIEASDFTAAKENYQLLLTKSDDSVIRLKYASLLQDHLNDTNNAKEHLEELLLQDKANSEVYFRLGQIAEDSGEFLAAKNYYERVIAMDSTYASAYHRLGMIVFKRFENQDFVAKSYFQEALNIDTENSTYHYDFASFLTKKQDYKKARKQLIESIDLDEDNAEAHFALAELYVKHLDKKKKARKYYLKAVALDAKYQTEANDLVYGVVVEKEEAAPTTMARGIQVKEPKEDALTVLVTGATSGIGLAIAEAFAADGHKVIMTGRRAERLRAMQFQFMKRYGVSPQVLAFDVRNREELAAQFATLPEGWRDIDVLVNNAGLAKGFAPIHEGSYEHWETMIDTNIKGLLYMTRLISPLMVERQSGHIINISSSAGKEVYPNGNVYCATKFAVEALTKGMRLDLHQHGIRVSSVSPGHVETEFALVRFDGNADKAKIYDDFQPLTAKDVADAVVYAATRPAHVNVENIHIFATQQASSTTLNRSGRKN
ncbi:MAG: SDR family NAD(P)-dependent oxidoreductase, partial [Saprospiraceae bacterium]